MAVVKEIDHILIRVDEPDYLFHIFAEVFQLPVVWPLASYLGFVTGGVFFGNVNLETLNLEQHPAEKGIAHYSGIAFEPVDLESSVAELKERAIPHGAPAPFISTQPDGSRELRWTNVLLEKFYGDAMIFLCQYAFDIEARRARNRQELAARQGGALGLQAVKEIVLGVTDLAHSRAQWGQFLAPAVMPEPDIWQLAQGPAIRLVQSEFDAIQGLVLQVADLAHARAFLIEQQLLGESSDTMLALDLEKTRGLVMRLVGA